MNYYEDFTLGHLVLPSAMMTNFAQLFPTADDFLVWLYFYENRDTAPSEIAKKIGKSLSDVNHSITALQSFGSLKVTLLEVNGDVETIFDIGPAFKKLDDIYKSTSPTSIKKRKDTSEDESQLKTLVNIFEAELGVISPMQVDELRSLLFEDKYDLEVIKLALREAVLNHKLSLKYIKAILRNWRNDGLNNSQAVENQQAERKDTQTISTANNIYIPLDGPWNN
ncbi:DnaD domain-containing protein [Lactococcus nasutitermitis]|uniref:DnaD domain-containing protein n=1 Tax=Lactococcus nasutitermitis TaxID=1652957 RepID=A0ABV9JGH9_9LACT|nr:DnaD domain-containing protein [Lactococcus nasutitermitis]